VSTTASSNEQWKHGGDCSICRKVKYCTTNCKENIAYRKRAILQILAQHKLAKVIDTANGKPMKVVNGELVHDDE